MSDTQIIETVQQYKYCSVDHYFRKSPSVVRNSIRKRALQEKKSLINLTL